MSTATTTVDTDAVAFFREHAGYSYKPPETPEQGRERCARALAAAEVALHADEGVFIVWGIDDIDSSSFDDDSDPHALYQAWLCVDADYAGADVVRGYDPRDGIFERPGRVVESLGGIDLGADVDHDDPYKRVIAAELYAEFEARREAAITRGDN